MTDPTSITRIRRLAAGPLRQQELRIWADGEPLATVRKRNWAKAFGIVKKAESAGSTEVHVETWDGRICT